MCGFYLVEGAVLGAGRWRVRKLAAETGNAHGDLLVTTGNQVVIRFMAARLLRGKVDHVKEVRGKRRNPGAIIYVWNRDRARGQSILNYDKLLMRGRKTSPRALVGNWAGLWAHWG